MEDRFKRLLKAAERLERGEGVPSGEEEKIVAEVREMSRRVERFRDLHGVRNAPKLSPYMESLLFKCCGRNLERPFRAVTPKVVPRATTSERIDDEVLATESQAAAV